MISTGSAGVIADPVLIAVFANRLDGIVRELSSTLLRAARSTIIAAADGMPVHIFGTTLQTQSMRALHDDLAEGDAFLNNDPYVGNSHAVGHALLVPVFAAAMTDTRRQHSGAM